MKVYIQAVLITLAAGILFVGAFAYWREQSRPIEAERKMGAIEKMEKEGLPNFDGTTITGEKVELNQFKGKVVVVNFWASWCAPCVEEFPSLLKLAEEMKGEMILIAVSGDSNEDEIRKFMRQLKNWERPWVKVMLDRDLAISKLYDVDRLPESFVAGTRLQLVKKIIGSVNWYTPESVQYVREVSTQ